MRFFEELKTAANDVNLELSEKQYEQFIKYMRLVQEWNEKINLTAITEDEEVVKKHFIDCIKAFKSEPIKNAKTVIDVGTGAGFPGIPLKIYRPDLNVTLVDSLNKRINFLNLVVRELGLKNVKTIHSRAEDGARKPELREKFDVATSRAVANLSTLSEYLIPLVKVGGKCICMKAANATEEIDQAKKAISVLCGAISKVDEFCLPQSDIGRTIIEIKKEKSTPNKYPRKAGLPSKEPIK